MEIELLNWKKYIYIYIYIYIKVVNSEFAASVYENVHFIFAQFSIISKNLRLILGNFQFNF